MHPQEKFIADARAIMKPSPVKLHHVPGWFVKRFRIAARALKREPIIESGSFSATWCDHHGSTVLENGRKAFVSEPYNINAKELAEIDLWAKAAGLAWYLSSNSWWYPGHTIRIVFEIRNEV